MIDVSLVFIAIAGIAFLGFTINALFSKLRIANILPLMIIGLLAGPVLKLINTGPQSVISELTPFITAITISFILFDVGMNLDMKKLSRILLKATEFSFVVSIITGIALGLVVHDLIGWTLLESFIAGFALASPSSIIVPTIVRLIKAPDSLKTTLIYESAITDIISLIVPLVLFGFIGSLGMMTASYIGSFVFTTIVGAVFIGMISATFWLYILNRFKDSSEEYSWMLTTTMIIATYGVSSLLGLNEAISVFVFGIAFATLGAYEQGNNAQSKTQLGMFLNKFSIGSSSVDHIKSFQKEIVFFTGAFFFVYIGLLFNISQLSTMIIMAAAAISFLMIPIRTAFIPLIKEFLSKDKAARRSEYAVISFDISRGLSPAVIATIPLTLGIIIPNFLNLIFLSILFTNIISTIGIFLLYRPSVQAPGAGPAAKSK
ncbi:MAG: cation:proton antiporter domain-containing protein [Candidatus Micrarchaeaceae archaeon]